MKKQSITNKTDQNQNKSDSEYANTTITQADRIIIDVPFVGKSTKQFSNDIKKACQKGQADISSNSNT